MELPDHPPMEDAINATIAHVYELATTGTRIVAASTQLARVAKDVAAIEGDESSELYPELRAALEHIQGAGEALHRAGTTLAAKSDVRLTEIQSTLAEGGPS